MRKTLFVSILLATLLVMQIFAEEHPLVKVKQYPQDSQSGLYLVREEIDTVAMVYDKPAGDPIFTAQYLNINPYGDIYVYQTNYSRLLKLGNDFLISDLLQLSIPNGNSTFEFYENSFLRYSRGGFDLFDYRGNKVVNYRTSSIDIRGVYYDEQSDVLFFQDNKNNLYSIEQPSMDEERNKANFKNQTETIAMLDSGTYAPHLTTKNNSLWIDNDSYYWYGLKINMICYQKVNDYKVSIFVPDNTVRFDFRSPNEQIESIEIHPCGDIYVLRMNWNTNTHILYRVENTWDPEWRASWYAEHPDAPGKELPSGNGVQAAATTVRTGYLNDDRIRLRKGPGTGTDSLGTYPVNTTFTIIEDSGVMQTIDGLTSEWIKVRLNDGTEGYFYGQYVSEK